MGKVGRHVEAHPGSTPGRSPRGGWGPPPSGWSRAPAPERLSMPWTSSACLSSSSALAAGDPSRGSGSSWLVFHWSSSRAAWRSWPGSSATSETTPRAMRVTSPSACCPCSRAPATGRRRPGMSTISAPHGSRIRSRRAGDLTALAAPAEASRARCRMDRLTHSMWYYLGLISIRCEGTAISRCSRLRSSSKCLSSVARGWLRYPASR